eukprot:4610982-Prorocentrum_lima.AAC.1
MTCPVAPAGSLWLWGGLRSCLPAVSLRSTRCRWFLLRKKRRDAVPSPRVGSFPREWHLAGPVDCSRDGAPDQR